MSDQPAREPQFPAAPPDGLTGREPMRPDQLAAWAERCGLVVGDAFQSRGRGVVVTLHVNAEMRRLLRPKAELLIVRPDGSVKSAVVAGIELFGNCFGDPNQEPRNMGLLLSGISSKEEMPPGSRLLVSDGIV